MNNNPAPFFSVIIPTYNRAQLIIKTLESVFSQSYSDYEIIVVDNKSTDNTVEVLEPFVKSDRIRLQVQDQNYERARSRNKGFELARGKFVTLLDSDDILYPDCLSDAYQFTLQNPDRKFFHCSYQIIDEQDKVMTTGNLSPVENPFRELANGNYISNIGIFLSKAIVDKVKVDETPVLIGMEDYDFLLHVLYEAKSVGFIRKINCGVLMHPKRTVLTQEMETIRQRVEYFVKKNLSGELFRKDFAPYKKSFVSSNHLYLCGAAAIRKLPREAFGHWLRAGTSNLAQIFTIRYWRHFLVIIKYMF
jgi:glycosyltransferase involved in cell wall biosynthesis